MAVRNAGNVREYASEKLKMSGEEALTRKRTQHTAWCSPRKKPARKAERRKTSGWNALGWSTAIFDRRSIGSQKRRCRLGAEAGCGDVPVLGGVRISGRGTRQARSNFEIAGIRSANQGAMRAVFAAGILAGTQRDHAAADKLFQESENLARKLGDKTGTVIALNAQAVLKRERQQLVSAGTI